MKMVSMDMLIALLASFLVSALIGPGIVKFLTALKIKDTERGEGPESHKKKAGTPLMGGIIFLIAIFLVGVPFCIEYPAGIPVLALTFGFGIIGFIDDYIKVVLKRNLGLRAWQKMGLQILVTAGFIAYLFLAKEDYVSMRIPFAGGYSVNLGYGTIPIMFFIILGTVNGSNFTDGVDGLESSVTAVIAGFFAVVSAVSGAGIEVVSMAVCGSLLGFLLVNLHPARVFMGDTGSLALGGFVAGAAYLLRMPIFLVLVAFIYMIEILSVILQVSYFKLTHGKRIFRMSPIHHHFELGGWSETKVVGVFTIVTFLLCVVAICAL